MDFVNPEWIGLLRSLSDAAATRVSAITDRLSAAGFDDSWEPGSPMARAVEQLAFRSGGQDLGGLYKMTVMHARRAVAVGMTQLDGIVAVLQASNLTDAHVSVAPLARSAAEHLGLTGWLLEPRLPPRTQIARHIVYLARSRQEFEGIRGKQFTNVQTERGVQFAIRQEQAAQQAGLSLRGRDHEHKVRGDHPDWIDVTLGAGTAVGIEERQGETFAPQAYGVLSSLSHPNIVEQIDRDRWDRTSGQTFVVPRARPEIIHLAALLVARLLRTSTWLLLHVWGLEEGWSEESKAIASRL